MSRVWQENAQDDNTDDFAVFDDDTGVDDGFGRDFSFKVEDFQSELDAAVRSRSLHSRCWFPPERIVTAWARPETVFPPRP